MRRNLLFGMFVVAVLTLRLWAQAVGEVGWQPMYLCGGDMYSDLVGWGTLGVIFGFLHGIVRVADTHARSRQRFNFSVLGI